MSETWRPVTRLERADFYSDWLAASERNALDVERSPIVARGREAAWIETPNEHRIAMLIGDQVGFPTNGTNLCTVAIPAGHHTGRHRHGEEAIHILKGVGFIVVAGRRYDFRTGTTARRGSDASPRSPLFVPYSSPGLPTATLRWFASGLSAENRPW